MPSSDGRCRGRARRRDLRISAEGLGTQFLPYFAVLAAIFANVGSTTEGVLTLSELNTTAQEPPVPLNDSLVNELDLANREILDETGYGHRKRDAIVEEAAGQVPPWPIAEFVPTRAPPLRLADIATVAPTAELVFHANESLAHVRTDAWLLPYETCLEARFRLEGKRTRLLIYTCQMTEGGECKLDKFTAMDAVNETGRPELNQNGETVGAFGSMNTERCVRLRPWMFHRTPFAFHFKFVRRPRRFSDPLVEERHRRRRRLGRRATREVGRVTMKGFKDCTQACMLDFENDVWLDEGSIHESNFSVAKHDYNKRRKRRRLHIVPH